MVCQGRKKMNIFESLLGRIRAEATLSFSFKAIMDPNLAIVHGSKEPALWTKTLGYFIDEQATSFGERPCVIFPWQSVRLSYGQLADRSKILAKAMLEMDLRQGDCVGIMAGNCYQYIEVFLGAARIGCPVVVLNSTYTPSELQNATSRSGKFC